MSSTAAEYTICEIPRDLTIKLRPKIKSWRDLQETNLIQVIDFFD